MNAEPHPLDLHRFTVRRRGYDRGEVDSILRRVADSLRRYEERIAELETHLAATKPTVPADPTSVTAPQQEPVGRNQLDLVDEATAMARSILIEADAAATRIAHEATEQARAHVERARAEAEVLLQRAHETLAAGQETAALGRLEAERVLEVATHMAEHLVTEAEEIHRRRDEQTAETAVRADAVVTEALAQLEKRQLLERISELRDAVQEVEREVGRLTPSTRDDLEPAPPIDTPTTGLVGHAAVERVTIDITDRERGDDGFDDPDGALPPPTVSDLRDRATNPFAAPDGSGRPPAARGTIDPAGPFRFARPSMEQTGDADARSGRSLAEAIAATRRQ